MFTFALERRTRTHTIYFLLAQMVLPTQQTMIGVNDEKA
jgi:hypothetical protein